MTIANQTNKTRQHGNGITDTFNFSFPIFQSSDLEVYKIDTTTTPETVTLLIEITDYTVEISKTTEGGSVTFVVTPTSDEDVFIKRVMEYTQETNIPINGNFPEENVENEFDKSRMLDVQNKEESDRTIKVNEFYDGSTDFSLPNPEAGKVIGYDATGLLMANYSGSDLDTVLTTSYGKQLVQSANATGARNALELGVSDDVEFHDLTLNDLVANDLNVNDIVANSLDLTEGALNIQGKYWIWGFIPTSGTDPDEEVTITKGQALCEDGFTIVKLDSDVSDLDLPTLNGGALGNGETYHLFRYKKNDNTDQWKLSNNDLTPTISDIKSALAYRRICSFKTDTSGDLYKFTPEKVDGGGFFVSFYNSVMETTTGVDLTNITLKCIPAGLKLRAYMTMKAFDAVNANVNVIKSIKDNVNYKVELTSNDSRASRGNGIIETDTSSRVMHGTVSGTGNPTDYEVKTNGYYDYRNNF